MNQEITGIHHVTAIASDPQQHLDFYTGLLGLRLVKVTVNFDDPTWPGTGRGRPGTGQATAVAFSMPESALGLRGRQVVSGMELGHGGGVGGISPVSRSHRAQ